MAVQVSDVLAEWTARGYIPASPTDADMKKYTSFINQAKSAICGYCKLPLNIVDFPDGLFYPWVEIGYAIFKGGVFQQSSGTVKSVSEGDTSVTFNTDTNKATAPIIDYSSALNAFRRLW